MLRERGKFGDGAILGPLSDYITAGSVPAALIERYLGATVHAVLVRDRAAADAIRAWHVATQPGPLLLLPVDTAFVAQASGSNDDLAGLVNATDSTAAGWVRALLGQVRPVEEATAFIDARGAIWLPAAVAGPGPLRRRAELTDITRDMQTAAAALRQAAQIAAAAREALDTAMQQAAAAADSAAAATREAKHAEEGVNEILRRHQRATREVSEADLALAKLSARADALVTRSQEIDAEISRITESGHAHDSILLDGRRALSASESAHDATRELRTAAQVQQAQAQARLQVVTDRERRLREEQTMATSRLSALQAELSTLSHDDAALTSQLADWTLDLEARDGVLRDT
ncbi:MAG: hypothetical protein ACREP1_07515, partial [Rhodanobacteraceae bacterium]